MSYDPEMHYSEEPLLGGGSDAVAKFEAQLREYETDKIACRLKVCCLLQHCP